MKEGIHPTYEPVTYIQTDGSEHVVRMSYTKEKVMTLQVDNLSHPAYTGKQRMLDVDGRQAKFDKKYGRK
ncbi:MAG: 50S ribosomal protein L31 [Proteobacteria bacterium]|nr:50S ribosomal protein L31 [Pseudomonadota bacterium]